MDGGEFITPCGPFNQPVSHIRGALLVTTLALAAILSAMLTAVPPIQHKIMFDLPFWDGPDFPPRVPRPIHVLRIDRNGQLTFNGLPCRDLTQLRLLVDLDQQSNPIPQLRVIPDPATRYDDFMQALAVIKRAHVYKLCIDFDPERRLTKELICREWFPIE
jgi:biopolymer transport protein ExbD